MAMIEIKAHDSQLTNLGMTPPKVRSILSVCWRTYVVTLVVIYATTFVNKTGNAKRYYSVSDWRFRLFRGHNSRIGSDSISMNIILATFLSFLPKRYREWFTKFAIPPAGAVVGGFLQASFSLYLLIRDYTAYTQAQMAAIPNDVAIKAVEKAGDGALMGLGGMFMLGYVIRITTILLAYFLVEGLARVIAAIGGHETIPTLPVKLVELLHSWLGEQHRERSMGELVPDEVMAAGGADSIRIATCRPKPWTNLTTVSHDGSFFELAAQEKASAPRPFIYVLRRKPSTAVIRGIYAYDPNELLPK